MTTKENVELSTYRKAPRLLAPPMEHELGVNGCLRPILAAVIMNRLLRLEIRDRRFSVYYGGGNLMLVDGRVSPWALRFDNKYFKGNPIQPPELPPTFSSGDDAHAWVNAFPALIAGMDFWWTMHQRGERTHCQALATANSGMAGPPPSDYLVLDLEYQWAQRRFDILAAKRNPTDDDPTGWSEPDLVFVEVKSEVSACSGKASLAQHARDYLDIIGAGGGRCVQSIKAEYQDLWAQKTRLGLILESLGFKRFSPAIPELLLVFVDLDRSAPSLRQPLAEIRAITDSLGKESHMRFMSLNSPDYTMTAEAAVLP